MKTKALRNDLAELPLVEFKIQGKYTETYTAMVVYCRKVTTNLDHKCRSVSTNERYNSIIVIITLKVMFESPSKAHSFPF